jgi:drug/metabolite transporter (DMT)-like permease
LNLRLNKNYMPTQPGQYRSYLGLAYLFVTIWISIGGNLLFQALLFPIFPYPIFISLISCAFPIVNALPAIRKGYASDIWRKYIKIAPLMLLNSILSNILYNSSLLLTSMSAVTVITSSSTLFSLLFSRLLLKTPIQFSTVISIHLSIVGSILVIMASTEPAVMLLDGMDSPFTIKTDDEYSSHILGCVFAFISSACSGLSSVLFQKLGVEQVDAYMTVSGSSAIIYTLIFVVLNRIFKFESLQILSPSSSWFDVCLILTLNGLMSNVLGTRLYINSLRLLSPVTVNVLWSISIPLTVIVDYYRGSIHTISNTFLLGSLLVLLSTVLVPIEQNQTDVSDTELQRDIPLLVVWEESDSSRQVNSSS